MALIRYAEGQQRSGHLGASVYSHNRGGQYIRARSIPTNPNTSLQIAVRAFMGSLMYAWVNTLTQPQRNLWKTYGDQVKVKNRLGEDIYLTGSNHYIRSNVALLQAGLTRIDNAPIIYTLADAEPSFSATGSVATQLISVSFYAGGPWRSEVGAALLVSQSMPQNPGTLYCGGPWRYVSKILGAVVPPTPPQTMLATYTMGLGQRIYLRSRVIRADGRLSNFAQTSFLVAA